MSCCFRQRVIAFFRKRKLLDERPAKNMLDWTHSGFSVDAIIRVPATSTRTREALAQYVVRAPVSLQNLLVDEGGTDSVIYRAPAVHGSGSPTWFASLPRGGSATIRGNLPSVSVPPSSLHLTCPSRPSRVAPHGRDS
jgi:hypothetical protein